MFVSPENMTFDNKKFSMIIYGPPGVGKTTLALSSEDPALLDFDRGVSRVSINHRKDTEFFFSADVRELLARGLNSEQVAAEMTRHTKIPFTPEIVMQLAKYKTSYDEVLDDLNSLSVKNADTIIIDTGGAMITFLQDWAMKTNPAQNRQKNGAISLKGFGAVKAEMNRFVNYVKDVMNKNLIFVFHSQEQMDKDGNPQQRLLCEGAFRNTVWNACDFGAFIQIIDGKRYACFKSQQEYFAKYSHGILKFADAEGKILVPELGPTDTNDFITKIFSQARANIAAEAEAYAPVKEQYDRVMGTVRKLIDGITDADSALNAMNEIKALDHASTSKEEAKKMLKEKAASIGLKYGPAVGRFIKISEEG